MSNATPKPAQDKLKVLLAMSGVILKSGDHLSNGSIDSFIFEADNYCHGQRENISILRIRNAIKAARKILEDRISLSI